MSSLIYLDVHFTDRYTLYHIPVNPRDLDDTADDDCIMNFLQDQYDGSVIGYDYSPA